MRGDCALSRMHETIFTRFRVMDGRSKQRSLPQTRDYVSVLRPASSRVIGSLLAPAASAHPLERADGRVPYAEFFLVASLLLIQLSVHPSYL